MEENMESPQDEFKRYASLTKPLEVELKDLKAENEKLREALREAKEFLDYEGDFQREALKPRIEAALKEPE